MTEDYSSDCFEERILELLKQERGQDLLDLSDRILAENPNYYSAWMGRFFALWMLQRFDEATEAHKKAFDCMTPKELRMYGEVMAERADEFTEVYEERLDELALEQERIGFGSESERREYYQESERMLKEMNESAEDFKRMFPQEKGRSKKKKKRDIS
ncbi:MAG: hypothetical protein MUC60_06260 [Oscillatoria sp. Prado101]|jgi:tetratricopeptide (TPR) repeat protein|nr:hypothetical protein [Oscillatoria sp. Prado101]